MTTTIEISLYPLIKEYPAAVIRFLNQMRALSEMEMHSNGMSTIIIGDYERIWPALGVLIQNQLEAEASVFVLKITAGRREYLS